MNVNFLETFTVSELEVQYAEFEAFVREAKDEFNDIYKIAKVPRSRSVTFQFPKCSLPI